jgi:hypothetical protein
VKALISSLVAATLLVLLPESSLGACTQPLTACVQGGRFQIEGSWTDHRGRTGTASVRALTQDAAILWFFSESNIEVLVKVVDGRALNNHYWVFLASLSDVAYTVQIRDLSTGALRTYRNQAGSLRSQADTQGFPDPGSAAVAAALSRTSASAQAIYDSEASKLGARCVATASALCLHQGRFGVEVYWRDHLGNSGKAQAVRLTRETGFFWFFSRENVELVIKILDGRAVSSSFWVIAGSLSDVEYVVHVVDLDTGVRRSFYNEPGRLEGFADTSTFAQSPDRTWAAQRLRAESAGFEQSIQTLLNGASLPGSHLGYEISSGLRRIFECLASASAQSGVTCPGLDLTTGTIVDVPVDPLAAQWLAGMLVEGGQERVARAALASAGDPDLIEVPGNVLGHSDGAPPGATSGDGSVTSSSICRDNAASAALGYALCRSLDPDSRFLAASRLGIDLACVALFHNPPVGASYLPACMVWWIASFYAELASMTYCSLSQLHLREVRVEPAPEVLLSLNDHISVRVLGSFANTARPESFQPILEAALARLLPVKLVPPSLRGRVQNELSRYVRSEVLSAFDWELEGNSRCERVLPGGFAGLRLQIHRGGGVHADGLVLSSGSQEAEGTVVPKLGPLAPWPSDEIRVVRPARVRVLNEVCVGSGEKRRETFIVPRDLVAQTVMDREWFAVRCSGEVGFWSTAKVPAYIQSPVVGLLASEVGTLQRCDGRWVKSSFSHTFPWCIAPFDVDCAIEGRVLGMVDAGVLELRTTWSGVAFHREQGDPTGGALRLTLDLSREASLDLLSGMYEGSFQGTTVWGRNPPPCGFIAPGIYERLDFAVRISGIRRACRLVSRCPD